MTNDPKKSFETLQRAAKKYYKHNYVTINPENGVVELALYITGNNLCKRDACKAVIKYVYHNNICNYSDKHLNNVNKVKHKTNKNNNGYSKYKVKDFYKSKEWRELRVLIIEQQKGRCQMCGRSYKEHDIVIHVDHIIPISIDWSKRLDINNLQLLCEDCNIGKSNHYTTDRRK